MFQPVYRWSAGGTCRLPGRRGGDDVTLRACFSVFSIARLNVSIVSKNSKHLNLLPVKLLFFLNFRKLCDKSHIDTNETLRQQK